MSYMKLATSYTTLRVNYTTLRASYNVFPSRFMSPKYYIRMFWKGDLHHFRGKLLIMFTGPKQGCRMFQGACYISLGASKHGPVMLQSIKAFSNFAMNHMFHTIFSIKYIFQFFIIYYDLCKVGHNVEMKSWEYNNRNAWGTKYGLEHT